MRIDQSQTPWLVATCAAAVVAIVGYAVAAAGRPDWPDGGSTVGLWYGLAGAALMGAAGLLVVVRRLPLTWRVGSRPSWLRAHVWLGSLSAVVLLCHTGFRWGGPLERLLWLTAGGVLVTGVAGLVVQHLLPRVLAARVPREAPPGYHDQACRALLRRGDAVMDETCGAFDPRDPADPGRRSGEDARRQVRAFYEAEVRPFLAVRAGVSGYVKTLLPDSAPLADALRAEGLFARLHGVSALSKFRPLLGQLASLCDERRLLAEQQRLSFWMHSWLLIHVPLSAGLLVLSAAHVIASLYY